MAIRDFHSAKPQHVRTIVGQGGQRVLTIYTGEVKVGHGAGGDRTNLAIEYPVLGLFRVTRGGPLVPGIIPCGSRDNLTVFHGAIAMAALSDIVDKTDPAVWDITNVRADLCEVQFNPSPGGPAFHTILAVVLRADVSAQRSEIAAMQYHVTVLSDMIEVPIVPGHPGSPTRLSAGDPHLVGDPDWDGTYNRVDSVLVPGVGWDMGLESLR